MANMLSKSGTWVYECCSHCARGRNWKPGKRHRRRARAAEKIQWNREYDRG